MIDLSRYVFEALRNDEEFILYRGQSKDDASQVLVLSPAVQRSTPKSLERLEHEYSLKEELDRTWAAHPIAIACHWDRTVLVLEDPGGVPLDQLPGQPVDVAFSLHLAISLSTAIGHLHQRGVIHKDVKPANVLVNSVTGQCWLMGFGIASRLPRERQSPEPPEFVAGTLAYMAPEQTGRMNRSIDSRSDLYSLGITLYEMLTGSLPFTASDPMEWVHCHIARQPTPPGERFKNVPASVSAIVMVHRAFEVANKIGDLTFAAYSYNNLNTNLLAAGDPLPEVQREAEHGLQFAQKARFGIVIDIITPQLGLIRSLRGLTPKFGSFDDEQFDELRFERHLANDPAALPGCYYWIRKLQARFFAGDYASAIDASLRAQQLLWTAPSQFAMAEYHFFSALSRAASCDSAFPNHQHLSSEALAKEEHLEALAAHYRQLEIWAENCPENFGNRASLVAGEIARVEGRDFEAMRLYEEAIRLAHTNGFVHNEALANELAAHFYMARGFEKIAGAYLRDTRYCYLRWGAAGKVRQLEQLYPQLREQEPVPGPTSTIGASVEQLDLATVIKVSQAVSGEIVLEKLIDTLMRIAIEYAGAERGLLILPRGTEQRIEAEATTSGDTITVRLGEALMAETAAPESIIHYVARTQESVILDDASAENAFYTDTYIRQHHARSILCLPLINQAKLLGLFYLENNLAPHVFTPTRIAVLKLLASQAAISLENIHLYRDLEEREAKIRRLVDANIMGIYIWNLQGEILEANEAFLHILRYSRSDVVSGGLRWTDLTPAEWRGRDGQAQAELIATGTIQPFKKEYFRKDGSRVPVLLGCATFEGTGNEGVAFVLDLSEQKRAEDALHQAQAELARVSRMTTMEQLAASIAHEVNQPLAAVVTSGNACLNWLSTSPPNLRKARDAVERIVRDGNRAGDVLKRVRTLLKKAPLIKVPLNVNEVIQEVLALVEGELRKRSVEVSAELDSNLPSVTADFVQLQQVLLNLVMNAIESMTAITDRPRVLQIQSRLRDLAGRCAVLVEVRDSGVGLSAEGMARVFEAFYSTKPEGMGMGLWICRSIIETHGGQLTAQPNDGVGATFQIVLPASAEESA